MLYMDHELKVYVYDPDPLIWACIDLDLDLD